MKLIVGLGNPSQKYEGTRHNVGFTVIDVLAEEYHITVNSNHHKALCGKGWIAGESVLLAKPADLYESQRRERKTVGRLL